MKVQYQKMLNSRPKHVAIVAMGPSKTEFTNFMENVGSWTRQPDEIWAINHACGWCRSHKVFLMDGFIDFFQGWENYLKKHIKVPVFLPEAVRGFPQTVTYPIKEVVNYLQDNWYENTISYAIAYAYFTQVELLSMWGCDFAFVEQRKDGKELLHIENGHAGVSWWLAKAPQYNCKLLFPQNTTLCNLKDRKFYGYTKQPIGKEGQ